MNKTLQIELLELREKIAKEIEAINFIVRPQLRGFDAITDFNNTIKEAAEIARGKK